MYPAYPPSLSLEQHGNLLSTIRDWAIAHGLAVRPSGTLAPRERNPGGVLAVPAPVTLFPSLFPKRCFDQALDMATAYNELYAKVAMDEGWLGDIMKEYV